MMVTTNDPKELPQRKSIRLKGYDYSRSGLYFITICTQNRLQLFGKTLNGEMDLNSAGMMIKTVWDEIPVYYQGFNIHEFIVMPNHIHGIIQIISNPKTAWTTPCGCPTPRLSLPDIVHRFKTLTTKRYVDGVNHNGWPRFDGQLWQRNYYEHIIRDEPSYEKISGYIQTNPLKWLDDTYYG